MTVSRVSRQAWLVWGAGVIAYMVAVLNRSSLAVAGGIAAERFDTGATVVATFAVMQLLVYAVMQIPAGALLDRFGSKRLLLVGVAFMVVGQTVLALATSVPEAIAARVLVGFGDAVTFVSVLRLVPAWFPARRVPVMTQLTGMVGQVGQVASAIPLVALLHGPGWTPAFLGTAALAVLAGVLVLLVLRDGPPGAEPARVSRPPREVLREVARSAREPGTRLGFWSHFTVQYSGTVFALLWGYPFLTAGQGLAPHTAASFLTLMVVVAVISGPVLGRLTGRHPLHRSTLVMGLIAMTVTAWTVVLAWPGPAPTALLVALVVVIAVNGPASMIGFDFARTFNPPDRLGSATGIVNVGGFVASLLTILAVGLVLDLRTPAGSVADLEAFRSAFAVQYVLWAVGLVGMVRNRRRARRVLASQGTIVLPVHQAWRRARREKLASAA